LPIAGGQVEAAHRKECRDDDEERCGTMQAVGEAPVRLASGALGIVLELEQADILNR